MGRLSGKVCIITGATSGIGERSVEIFLKEGATVVFAGRRVNLGETIQNKYGGEFIQCNVAIETDVINLIDQTIAKHGKIDCFFANAGASGPQGGIATMNIEEYNRCIAVNLSSVVYCMKHVAPHMRKNGGGSFITTASVAGIQAGYSSSMMYSVAKAAVIHLTKLVAMELGEDNIRVNTISPGAIPTGIFGKAAGLSDDVSEQLLPVLRKQFAKAQPIPRAGLGDDIAYAAVFLASDESSFVNAIDIVVDGGLTGGNQWTAQQSGLTARNNALRKMASKL